MSTDEPHPPARIVVIEDDPMVRQYVSAIINDAPHLDLVALAPDLAAGRSFIGHNPDLFLMDIGLPDGSGYDLVPEIKAGCDARALILSSFGDRDTVVRALQAGADGYLLKDSTPQQILDGIATTLDGGAPVSPSAAIYLLDYLRSGGGGAGDAAGDIADDRLTPRETELLRAFATGQSYKEAARTLGISPHTVGNHVKAIYRKLEVTSRSEAIRAARG